MIEVDRLTKNYGLVAAILLGGAYSGYELWVRRAFAIDDVFLISKEGRLMMHNTRRMRADRDEAGHFHTVRLFPDRTAHLVAISMAPNG